MVSAVATLYSCKSNMYISYEKIQTKKQKKGKEYTLDEFASAYKRMLLINEIGYGFFTIILFIGLCWLTFMIATNWFVTMTVFMNFICIGLIFLMVVTIRESRKKRKCLDN
jgi:uncharacterized membrane protein YesL